MKNINKILFLLMFLTIIMSIVNTQVLAGVIDSTKYLSYSEANEDIVVNGIKVKTNKKSTDNKYQGRYVVKLKENLTTSQQQDYFNQIGIDSGSSIFIVNSLDDKIVNNNYVDKIEEDAEIDVQETTVNDPRYNDQWYLKGISFPKALSNDNTVTKKIAVLDSGICLSHEDLQNQILAGTNIVDNNSDVNDQNGHGCAVSGIIAANTNNNLGISGVGINVKIIPIKVISSDGIGSYSDLIKGINFAIDNKVDIINISLGGRFDSDILYDVIKKASEAGIKIIASAGNTANSEIMYPAKYDEVISVGSVKNDYTISNFSSNSHDIKAWSFGDEILSTNKDGGYSTFNGTSFSAPIVSAFIADGGSYVNGGIINFEDVKNIPIFPKQIPQEYTNNEYNWSVSFPSNWTKEIAINNQNGIGQLINQRIIFHLNSNEIITVDVWKSNEKKSLFKVFQELHLNFIQPQDSPSKENGLISGADAILAANLHPENQNVMHKVAMFMYKNVIYRIAYSIVNGVNENSFITFLNNFQLLNSKKGTNLSNLPKIPNEIFNKISVQTGQDTCGPNNEYSLIGNPFPCSNACPNTKTNCTWWAIYKRPDLKDKITWGNAGSSWITQANQANISVTNTVVDGSIVVWEGHVAYVTGHNSNGTFNISEMNCNNTAYPGPRDATVTDSYGSDPYKMTLDGFIGFSHNTDLTIQNQTISGGTFSATNSITVLPETTINPQSSDVIFNISL